ncbi:MAG TPA: hypothetical protein VH143_20245 [Kofleriaceae bacterium]|nr:hypothetical protein [Kofleriaceae bacterium]
MLRWLGLGATVLLVAACPPPGPPTPIPSVASGKVRVRVFTEPSPVKSIDTAGRYLFVATDDSLQRWDESGQVMVMTADHGLSGDHVTALAPDLDRKWLWVLTDGGLGHYDASSEIYTDVAPPPAAMGIDYTELAKDGASMASAAEGGVWMGTTKGLVFASDKGGWLSLPIKDAVRALVRDRSGWLWVAAKGGLYGRKPNGDIVKIGPVQGCEIAEPRLLALAPGDRVLAIGTDADGHERIAVGKQLQWTSYRTLPDITWDAVTEHGDSIILMGGGRVYRISPATPGPRPLARDGVRLVPSGSADTNDWEIDPIDLVLPPGATAMGAIDDKLLIGTRDLGTARYRAGDPHPLDWLRRKQMFEDASSLSVACTNKPTDCWLATGARQAWHWTGDRLSAAGPDQIVVAVARDPSSGAIYALHRAPAEHDIRMSRIDGATWTPIPKIDLTTPGDAPEISFARFASPGVLWLGLRYRDGAERRPFGIAIVDIGAGTVAYQRETNGVATKTKMLPIPIGTVDADVRGDVAWLATDEGVARLANGALKVWTEADGLRSELARAITVAQDGSVIVATGAGAMVFDGHGWSYPPALQFEINDLVATKNGQIWMATERGIAAWDGKKLRRVDTRRGLAENSVLDVATDQFDRVWARGPGSLTLVSQ